MKKHLIFLAAILIAVCFFSFGALNADAAEPVVIANGSCGKSVSWKLDDSGTLTISGLGEMDDFAQILSAGVSPDNAPWADYSSEIESVIIQEGVTKIGAAAFYSGWINGKKRDYRNFISIDIPDSVTAIGQAAFYGCSNLTSIDIPDGVTTIGQSAFYECSKLASIRIPDGVTRINDFVFYGCSSLTNITIPDAVTAIGNCAFVGCIGLTSMTVPDGVTVDRNSEIIPAKIDDFINGGAKNND